LPRASWRPRRPPSACPLPQETPSRTNCRADTTRSSSRTGSTTSSRMASEFLVGWGRHPQRGGDERLARRGLASRRQAAPHSADQWDRRGGSLV